MLARLCRGWAGAAGALPARSRLTPSRAPLEFSFRGAADEIRYTADPGPPGAAAQWRAASQLLPDVEAADPLLERVTGVPGARAGLWLGIRHRGASTDAKVYRRLGPRYADHARAALAGAARIAPPRHLLPLLAGLDSQGAIEVYGRMVAVSRSSVHGALACGGAASAFRAIEACVADLRDRQTPAAWDDLRVGISWRAIPDGPVSTTVFLHAVELFENDLIARERVLELASRLGVDLRDYRDVTAALQSAAPPPVHGLVALTARADGGVELTVGMAADERLGTEPLTG